MFKKTCNHCNNTFETRKIKRHYCSAACRQAAYRERKENQSENHSYPLVPYHSEPTEETEEPETNYLPDLVEDVPFEEVTEPPSPAQLPAVNRNYQHNGKGPLVLANDEGQFFDPDPLVNYQLLTSGWMDFEISHAHEFNRALQGWLVALFELEKHETIPLKQVEDLLQKIVKERKSLQNILNLDYPYHWWTDETLIPRLKKFVVHCKLGGWEEVTVQLEDRFREEAREVLYVVWEL